MKAKLIFSLLIFSIVIFCLSFRRKAGHLTGGTVNIYYMLGANSYVPDFVTLLPDAVSSMSPYNASSLAPIFAYSGATDPLGTGGPAPFQNSTCEFGYAYTSNASAAAATADYNPSNNLTYTEFDFFVNSNFSNPSSFGNGYSNTVDRGSILKHELGHGIGLDHSGNNTLMKASFSPSANPPDIFTMGPDEINGIKCIYEGVCNGDEACVGNIEISTKIYTINKKNVLTWMLETDSKNRIVGFNILSRPKKSSIYSSLNTSLIKVKAGQVHYSLPISGNLEDLTDTEFYLEVVYENIKNIIPITVQERKRYKPATKSALNKI